MHDDDGTTTMSISIELQAPQLRPEAFPWGSANVEVHAVFASEASRRVLSLPGVMDLGALLFPAGKELNGYSEPPGSLDVAIMGRDNGVTFALGNASIPLPPMLQAASMPASSPFRVCLTGEEGMRTGTLVGKFQAGSLSTDDLEAGEAAGTSAPQVNPASAVVGFRAKIAGEAADDVREADNDMAAGQASKDDHQKLEHEAIELLEAATKILASPSSSVGRRARPADSPTAARRADAHENTNDPGFHDVLPRQHQVPDGPLTDVSSDFDVNGINLALDSAPPSNEDERLPPPRFPTAGFKFEPTTGNVEWQRIASVNVSKVEREGDLQTLKQFLPEVAVGMMDEDLFDASPGLVNAFRLAQLQTQYVLHCSQVLQRQRDGLETAVGSMELEAKGNLQGSTALKNRSRLLRKESRKQDKIINGYAAMLRTHNPALSSKVFLDESGRLKVHKETRHREHGKRRRKRRNRGYRDHQSRPLGGGTQLNSNGSRSSTDTEGPGFGSGASQGTSSRHWSEAGGPVPAVSSPRRPSNTETMATSVPEEDQRSAFHLDTGEAATASTAEHRGVIVATEQNRTIGARGNGGETMTPRGTRGRRASRGAEDSGRARTRDDDDGDDGDDGDDVVQVLPRDDDGTSRAGLSLRDHPRKEQEQHAFSIHRVDTGKSPARTLASARDGRALADPDDDDDGDDDDDASKSRNLEAPAASKVGGDEQAPLTGHRKILDRAPRVVTVSVRPKRNQRPTSASSQEEYSAASPQRQGRQAGNKIDIRDPELSCRNDGIDSSEASPVSPAGFAAKLRQIPAAELTAARENGQQPHSGGGGANSERASLERGFASSGAKEEGNTILAAGHSAPVAAASQLGLEGDGFPDVSEFDLDDISEIDAGGGWAGSDGGGSLSS